jgi:hypothetical protein
VAAAMSGDRFSPSPAFGNCRKWSGWSRCIGLGVVYIGGVEKSVNAGVASTIALFFEL